MTNATELFLVERTVSCKETTPEEIVRMAVSQKPFFGKKGGITFSGGEPTFQAKALVPLFRQLKEAGIHICVDTNGGIWNKDVEELFTLADLVLLDVKEFNNERHQALTSRSNEQTLKTAAWLEEHGKPFWLRYVLVPLPDDTACGNSSIPHTRSPQV